MIVCPDRCSGGKPERQNSLTEFQLEEISESASDAIKKSNSSAMRCNYCGCVYLEEGNRKIKLGDLDGGVTGAGWDSKNYPNI